MATAGRRRGKTDLGEDEIVKFGKNWIWGRREKSEGRDWQRARGTREEGKWRSADWARQELEKGVPWWNVVRKYRVFKAIFRANTAYKLMERSFLFEGGLDGRSWFKHVVFAPGLWTGYAGGELFLFCVFQPLFLGREFPRAPCLSNADL